MRNKCYGVFLAMLLLPNLFFAPNTDANCKRSATVKRHFQISTGYPHGRPGYVVDHIIPLACGGIDSVTNMQWQTVQEAKMKDKTELRGCHGCKGVRSGNK